MWLRIWCMILALWSNLRACMVTLLIQTFSVSGIKCVSLPGQYHLVLRLDLIRVIGASCMRNTHSLVIHVEDEVVLAHQGAAD